MDEGYRILVEKLGNVWWRGTSLVAEMCPDPLGTNETF